MEKKRGDGDHHPLLAPLAPKPYRALPCKPGQRPDLLLALALGTGPEGHSPRALALAAGSGNRLRCQTFRLCADIGALARSKLNFESTGT